MPASLLVSDFPSVSFGEVELDFEEFENDFLFLFNLSGRICNLGFSSVPEFSAAN